MTDSCEKRYELTVRKTTATYDSDDLLCDGRVVGYRAKWQDGAIGLTRCPACGLENHAMSVATGTCAWCGWDIHESASITDQ